MNNTLCVLILFYIHTLQTFTRALLIVDLCDGFLSHTDSHSVYTPSSLSLELSQLSTMLQLLACKKRV